MDPTEFPPKPGKAPKEAVPLIERPKTEQIVTGAVQRKKGLGRKFRDVFFDGDFKRARDYVLFDKLVPAIKWMIVDTISSGTERVVMGETSRQRNRIFGQSSPRIQYNSPIRRDPRELGAYSGPHPTRQVARQSHEVGELVLETREEAELVVEQLMAIADQYDYATVGQLYGLLGFPTTYVDEQWGWKNLSTVEIKQVRTGFLIDLPDPESVG